MTATQEGRIGAMAGREPHVIPNLQPKEPGKVEELPNSEQIINMLVYVKHRNMVSNRLKVCTDTLK